MIDKSDGGSDPAILRILRSDLPQEKKLVIIEMLAEEAKSAQPHLDALKVELLAAMNNGSAKETVEDLAGRLIAETEEHLRRNG